MAATNFNMIMRRTRRRNRTKHCWSCGKPSSNGPYAPTLSGIEPGTYLKISRRRNFRKQQTHDSRSLNADSKRFRFSGFGFTLIFLKPCIEVRQGRGARRRIGSHLIPVQHGPESAGRASMFRCAVVVCGTTRGNTEP